MPKEATMPCIFSVIIPAYNAEKTLEAAVESAVLQSLDNRYYEIIIVDDGSTDATYSLMEQLRPRTDNIRIFKNNSNQGLGRTRNRGLEEAIGEYVTFLDADDLMRSDALEKFYQSIPKDQSEDQPEIVYANIKRINKFGDQLSVMSRHSITDLKSKIIGGSWSSVGAVYQKKFLGKHYIKFLEGSFYEDIEFSVKAATKATKVKGIDQIIYYWISRPGSITNSMSFQKCGDAVRVLERVYNILEESNNLNIYLKD
jgi:glycosyltransferase involved in cell wall biosynthesis